MASVMISIRPEWCEKIASGEKTVEVRKSRPKLEPPFKCYIYQTRNGGVIGEFTCDRIFYFENGYSDHNTISREELERRSCLNRNQLENYEYSAKPKDFTPYVVGLFCWSISDLKIYNNPMHLSQFTNGSSVLMFRNDTCLGWTGMKRPPQSWCYVDDVEYMQPSDWSE